MNLLYIFNTFEVQYHDVVQLETDPHPHPGAGRRRTGNAYFQKTRSEETAGGAHCHTHGIEKGIVVFNSEGEESFGHRCNFGDRVLYIELEEASINETIPHHEQIRFCIEGPSGGIAVYDEDISGGTGNGRISGICCRPCYSQPWPCSIIIG